MKKVFTLITLLIFLSNCYGSELLISAASSLKDVFTEIGKEFEKEKNIKVSCNFAASGVLRAQIENGAPVDLFASASLTDMEILIAKKLIIPKSKQLFARNSLVFAQNADSKIVAIDMNSLKDGHYQKIVIGNPNTVPVGMYANESLLSSDIFQEIKFKLIYAESARQVLDYIVRNEVDGGFVFLTDALSEKKIKTAFNVDEKLHTAISYPVAILQSTKYKSEAGQFIEYLNSEKAKAIFTKYGFR